MRYLAVHDAFVWVLTCQCRLGDSMSCSTCRYILWEAEERGLLLPYACRMGCCTACAVRVLQGDLHQPQVRTPSLCAASLSFLLLRCGVPESALPACKVLST